MLLLRLILALPLAALAVYEGTLTLSSGSAGLASASTTNVTPPPPWRPKSGATAGPYASPTREFSSKSTASQRRWTYDWPLKPFDRPHPVRAYLNDPRVSMSGDSHSFHFGVDISARRGTAVYAIEPGTVHLMNEWAVQITSGTLSFQYWHIVPAVHEGQRVGRHKLLGRTRMIFNHVHLTEVRSGHVMNPVRPGGIGPFADHTTPRTTKVTFRKPGRRITPNAVHGTVDLVADAFDPAADVTPAPWPVTPALLRWRIFKHGNVVVGWHTAFDFRTKVLPMSQFAHIYAPGTRQNHPDWPGYYCFYLGHGWRSESLPNGRYQLEVAASDIRGNRALTLFPFTVAN